jgi:hypothetical protein
MSVLKGDLRVVNFSGGYSNSSSTFLGDIRVGKWQVSVSSNLLGSKWGCEGPISVSCTPRELISSSLIEILRVLLSSDPS